MSIPGEGQPAPDFELDAVGRDGEPERVRLSDLRGQSVVLYFYPKDDTPGCTKQACGIRDAWPAFGDTGARVFGVSPDDVESHVRFARKHELPFPLLADPDHAVAERYGVWQEKSMYGKKYMGVARTTFVIDPDGRIAKVFEKVKPKAHADQVLEALA